MGRNRKRTLLFFFFFVSSAANRFAVAGALIVLVEGYSLRSAPTGKGGEGRSLVARRRVEGFGSRRGDATVVTPRARSTSGAWRADGPRGVSRASRLNADRIVAAARKTKAAARR